MTEKTLDWLNHNRYRAYPFVNDEGLLCNGKRIPDCILLDCLVTDTRHGIGIPQLVFTRVVVSQESTVISFTYQGVQYTHTLTGSGSSPAEDELSGEGSVVKVAGGAATGLDDEYLYASFVFSSHAYILANAGIGTWEFNGKVLPSKVVSVTASGVSGLQVHGSSYVSGFETAGTACGNVHLVDGYRTQPVIQNGKVLVKIGNQYGEDPCHYAAYDTSGIVKTVCDDLMFFFCGQNAINGGNVQLNGGPGVSIRQGRKYTAKHDIIDTYGQVGVKAGESLPCIEIVATSELLRIYRPSEWQEGSSSGGSFEDPGDSADSADSADSPDMQE